MTSSRNQRSLKTQKNIKKEIESYNSRDYSAPEIGFFDDVIYIFTSGTTGLPKAARMKNSRILLICCSFNVILNTTENDVIWSPLPLYHSQGGVVGIGQTLYAGSCVAFRPKFSASNFWKDIIKAEATVFIYLGEICRYIYAQPVAEEERQHKIRAIIGAGLKKEIWNSFINRFGISNIFELYGSTEGNANMINFWHEEGSCGFISRLFSKVVPLGLIRMNEDGTPMRDSNGLCVHCKPGEPGQVVGRIVDNDYRTTFDGYLKSSETSKKIATDVFKKGDRAFLSGDTMVMDRKGFLYFKDRTGDTFRWKGENVSTTEVEAIILPAVGQKDVIVYGVEIPNADGRAGMAAILNDEDNVDMNFLTAVINKNLPTYARPMFIRLLTETAGYLTGTCKLKKVELRDEGFMKANEGAILYFYDLKTKSYQRFTEDTKQQIIDEQIKF